MSTCKSRPPLRTQQGNVLLATIILVLSLTTLSLALLETGTREVSANVAAGELSKVRYLCETGVNEAIADLVTGGTGNVGSSDSPLTLGGGEYWARSADRGDGTYEIVSIARLNEQDSALLVVAVPEILSLFSRALFGDLDLGAGGTIFTDSFDSTLGPYADQATNIHPETGQRYARMGGDLASNRGITLRGGAHILGDATPGPGYSVQVDSNVVVSGSIASARSTTPIPPVEYSPPGTASGPFDADSSHVFSGGVYHFTSFDAKASADIRISGDVVLYVDGDFRAAGNSGLVIEPDSSLVIYHAGSTFSVSGGGLLNEGGQSMDLRLFTQASQVSLTGGSSFSGVVYAPHGNVDPGGTTDLFGSFVAKSVSIVGTASFHYDEALARFAPNKRFRLKPVSWKKLSVSAALQKQEELEASQSGGEPTGE